MTVSDVKAFLLLGLALAQASEGSNLDFFRYPQNGDGYPHMSGVIHGLVHSISTGHHLQISAGPSRQPPVGLARPGTGAKLMLILVPAGAVCLGTE